MELMTALEAINEAIRGQQRVVAQLRAAEKKVERLTKERDEGLDTIMRQSARIGELVKQVEDLSSRLACSENEIARLLEAKRVEAPAHIVNKRSTERVVAAGVTMTRDGGKIHNSRVVR